MGLHGHRIPSLSTAGNCQVISLVVRSSSTNTALFAPSFSRMLLHKLPLLFSFMLARPCFLPSPPPKAVCHPSVRETSTAIEMRPGFYPSRIPKTGNSHCCSPCAFVSLGYRDITRNVGTLDGKGGVGAHLPKYRPLLLLPGHVNPAVVA